MPWSDVRRGVCPQCGHYWTAHVNSQCPSPVRHVGVATYNSQPAPTEPLTEEVVRRIVREELEKARQGRED